ncbi:MAG: hypothetical protein VW771_08095, partial [Gammaproteobacteria bacterium]
LWHFPSAHAVQTLSGTLPCGARTFLDLAPSTPIGTQTEIETAVAQPTPRRTLNPSRTGFKCFGLR